MTADPETFSLVVVQPCIHLHLSERTNVGRIRSVEDVPQEQTWV